LNASKFVLGLGEEAASHGLEAVTNPGDVALLAALKRVVVVATAAFERFDYTSALEATETFFWSFCDDYLELVKERAYGGQGDEAARSAQRTLLTALEVQLRLLAPFLPFATEEVWSWTHPNSIHHTAWPTTHELGPANDAELIEDVAAALIALRGTKSTAKVSMKTPISRAEFTGRGDVLERLQSVDSDLRAVGRIEGGIEWIESDQPLTVRAELVTAE